jgi:LytS/YehU family sensor histidine kinase
MIGQRLFFRADPQAMTRRWGGLAIVVASCLVGYTAGTSVGNLVDGMWIWPIFAQHPQWLAYDFGLTALSSALILGWFFIRARGLEHRAHAAAATHEATLARLVLLQSQLEPHMLFNTLANLRALIVADPARAQAMLDRLIDFLRATLAASRRAAHPLRDEFARVDDYLALMQVRMGDRLRFETTLPPGLAGVLVPPLLLQPLVENAIKHGLEPQRGPGELAVSASADGSTLVLCVADRGRGLDAAATDRARADGVAGAGFGLAQLRERLHTLHGDAASFTLSPQPGGGTLAEIRLPLETPR